MPTNAKHAKLEEGKYYAVSHGFDENYRIYEYWGNDGDEAHEALRPINSGVSGVIFYPFILKENVKDITMKHIQYHLLPLKVQLAIARGDYYA